MGKEKDFKEKTDDLIETIEEQLKKLEEYIKIKENNVDQSDGEGEKNKFLE